MTENQKSDLPINELAEDRARGDVVTVLAVAGQLVTVRDGDRAVQTRNRADLVPLTPDQRLTYRMGLGVRGPVL